MASLCQLHAWKMFAYTFIGINNYVAFYQLKVYLHNVRAGIADTDMMQDYGLSLQLP